jgi:hypothetical protein
MPTESRRQLVIEKHIIIYLYAFGDSIRNIITDGLPNKNDVPNKKKWASISLVILSMIKAYY